MEGLELLAPPLLCGETRLETALFASVNSLLSKEQPWSRYWHANTCKVKMDTLPQLLKPWPTEDSLPAMHACWFGTETNVPWSID